jgi:imidazolonepropionase-like amidohydrolase
MRVFAHPTSMEGATIAIDAGVDVLAHTNSDGWEPSLIEHMIAADVALVPTLKLWLSEAAREDIPENEAQAFVQIGIDELAAFAAAGGRVLFGTDVGYMPDYDTADEYRLMARAKLSPMAILAALTTSPAAEFGEEARRGRVAPGLDADLVVLGADPAKDVASFANVRYTIRGGRVIYSGAPSRIAADGPATPPPAP